MGTRVERPKLAEVSCKRIHFESGDRVLVKVQHALHPEQKAKLTEMVQNWAGPGVRVLVVDARRMEIEIERSSV